MKIYNVKYDWGYPEIGTRVAQKKEALIRPVLDARSWRDR